MGGTGPDKKDENESDISRPSLLVVSSIIIISIVIVVFPILIIEIQGIESIELRDLLSAISAVGTISLSGILAYLYYRSSLSQSETTNVQKQQKEILEGQEEFLEATTLPRLVLEEWTVNNNEVDLKISNLGNGPALEIGILAQIRVSDEEFTIKEPTQNRDLYVDLGNPSHLTTD